jgi:hypothetical protein
MKKIILSLAVIAIALGANAQKGGSDGNKQNVVKVNPLGVIFGNIPVSYERVINEKSSVQVNVSFGSLNFGGVKYSNLGFGVDYRYYLSNSKEAPKGFYGSGGVGFNSTKISETGGTSVSGNGFIVKAVVGNQWTWDSGFTLDLYGGINYYAGGKIKGAGGVEYGKFSGALPTLGLGLGYNF